MTKQKTYRFNNLEITKTRVEDKTSIIKFVDVVRFENDLAITLDETDPDYKKALILSINVDNEVLNAN